MKVLIACEESQEVCKAFRALGHEAYSCDIQEPSGGHPEWHILGDALKAIEGGQVTTMDGQTHDVGRWDMIIAFPPCTKTSNAGARHLYRGGKLNIKRYYEGLCGKALFLAIWAADCEKVVIENPTPSKVFEYPEPTQVIQPYQYGHPFSKKTLLWERGVQPLEPTNIVEPTATWCPSGSYSHKHGEQHKGMFTTDRAKNRAKTFPGIARAMAEQWGGAMGRRYKGGTMKDTNLVNALREHAEWARANEWETPITLGDDLVEAAANQSTHIAALQQEIEKLRGQLKAYEDTELMPEEIDMDHEAAEQLRHLCRDCDLERLEKLAEADRDGRVVVLPCKVGGEVYSTLDDLGRLHQCRATYVLLNEKPYLNTVALEPVDYEGSQYGASFGAFGQTVFLTREEAEKALEEMKDE